MLNKPLKISTSYFGKSFNSQGDLVQNAINKPLDRVRLIKNLSKTGDTPFIINEVIFESFEEGFIPMASLNLVRRELIESVQNYIIGKYKREKSNIPINYNKGLRLQVDKKDIGPNDKRDTILPETLIVVSSEQQLKATVEMGFNNIAINPFMRGDNMDLNINDVNTYIKCSQYH